MVHAGHMDSIRILLYKYALVCVLVCAFGIALNASEEKPVEDGPSVEQVIEISRKLNSPSITKSNIVLHLKELSLLLKSKTKNVSYRAAAELAGYYRSKSDLSKAAEIGERFSNIRKYNKLSPIDSIQYLRGILEYARILAKQKNETKCLEILGWAESLEDKYAYALSCLSYAEILLDMGELERAKGYFESAQKVYNAKLSSSRTGAAIGQAQASDGLITAEWQKIAQEGALVKARLTQTKMEKQFGAEYGLYCFMRICISYGNYDKAQDTAYFLFTNFKNSIFADCAEFTYGYCVLVNSRRISSAEERFIKAQKIWDKFFKNNPNGAYRGEAKLLLGEFALSNLWQLKLSKKYTKEALDYYQYIRKHRDMLSLYAPLKDGLSRQVTPEKKLMGYDRWNRIVRSEEKPLRLYNAFLSPEWYLDEKEKECCFLLGFLYFSEQKYDEAEKLWSRVINLDSALRAMKKNAPNVQKRLLAACRDKRIAFTDDEKRSLENDQDKLRFLYAEYLYMVEDFEKSRNSFSRQYYNTNKKAYEKQVLLLSALGAVCDAKLDKDSAFSFLLKALDLKQARKSRIYGNAMYRYANALCGVKRSGFNGPKEALPYFNEYIDKYSCKERKDWLRIAKFKTIACYIAIGQFDKAKGLISKFPSSDDNRKQMLVAACMKMEKVASENKKK